MKTLNSYYVTFSDVSVAHLKMFLPFTRLMCDSEVDQFKVGYSFEIERLTDEKRYWKCEYVVTDIQNWAAPNVTVECVRGKDTCIILRPPIEIGKPVEYGRSDLEIEMDIQNKMFSKGLSREDAVMEVFNEA